MASGDMCSKCNAEPRAGKHPWGLKCYAEWKRNRSRTEPARHFSRGVETLRSRLVEAFAGMGNAELSGYAAAEMVRGARVE